jgi:thiol-disulfide isomerase/thioredoxin
MKRILPALLTGIAAVAVAAELTMTGMPNANAAASAPEQYRSTLPVEGTMPSLEGADTWLNSAPLSAQRLRGKVVLVDFWTYSCINCIRTIPYVRAWAAKYRDKGLVVIGVHTPEFAFEKDLSNVNAAVARFQIDFPIAIDSDQRIWRAFGNRFWPAYYLVDANGKIRYHQYGEGNYDKTERAIQDLLAEARQDKSDSGLVGPVAKAEQMAPGVDRIRSEETYVGYAHESNFSSPEGLRQNGAQHYTVGELGLNDWGLSGNWTVGAERAVVNQPGAGIAYRFSARDLHLVLGPGARGKAVHIKVMLDGHAPGPDHGADIDAEGNGTVTETRLYQLVRQAGNVRQRRFEIRFLDKGAEAYVFTFG